jgi:hypothetical protein
MKGTETKPPPAPRQEADDATSAELPSGAGQRARGLGLLVEQHLRGRETHECREEQRQPAALEHREDAQAGHGRAEHDAGRQALDDVPAHGAALVVRAHAGDAGEDDGGHRGGDRHLDGEIGCDATAREDEGDEGHHQHSAADAEQASEETGADAEKRQFGDQQGFEGHGE